MAPGVCESSSGANFCVALCYAVDSYCFGAGTHDSCVRVSTRCIFLVNA